MYPCPEGTSSWPGASECSARGAYDGPSAQEYFSPSSFSRPPARNPNPGIQPEDSEADGDADGEEYTDDGESEWPAHPHTLKKDACFELGEMSCPGLDGKGRFCIDPMTNLEACGGCSLPDEFGYAPGTDCTALEGALDVSCQAGNCLISSCRTGFGVVHTSRGMQCVKDYDRLLAKAQMSRPGMQTGDDSR
ncbi:hypothetical protein DACRYDRAFT_106217 [Dacryopinax primogenitus]|uniref:Protein CPL1-like domain-containing protein n=1 Tax=Dacryopinax primogenitus (strain DJM 731) TaxID=1858805 RepID=M5G2W6_DACPD|nr:uncharacterized protein DACRYDRAFT_106217 [Dacryopinax primogenitus]EJU03039.1 hypothetical protein DACRYDRAFT_106217 [Dacryopinax primogenitus]